MVITQPLTMDNNCVEYYPHRIWQWGVINWTTIWICVYSVTLTLEYKKRLLLRCIHHFKSDLITNMDHMRISGTEPSSVILSQRRVVSKVENWCPKSVKTSWSLMGWCNKPTNNNSVVNIDWHGTVWCSQNATNQPKSTVELCYMCLGGLTGPPAVTLTK